MKKVLLLCALTSLGSSLYAAPKIIKKITRPHGWFFEPVVGGGIKTGPKDQIDSQFSDSVSNIQKTKRSVVPFGGVMGGLKWDNVPGAGKDGGLVRLSVGIFYEQKSNLDLSSFIYNPAGAAAITINTKTSTKMAQIPVEVIYNFLREENFMMLCGAGIDFSFQRDGKIRLFDDQDRFYGASLKPKKFHVFGTARAGLSWTFRKGHHFTLNYWFTGGKVNFGKAFVVSAPDAGIVPIVAGPLAQGVFEKNIKQTQYSHYFYLGYIRDFSF